MGGRFFNRVVLATAGIVALGVMVLPVAGAAGWYLAGSRTIDVLVYDATVPTAERRQHRAVERALTYFHVPFDGETDYVGSAPGGQPFGTWPSVRPDLALLVDAYGVYVDESGRIDEDGTVRVSETFPLAAAEDVTAWAEQGTVVMGEFNILHLPTAPDVSEVLQGLFEIDATGWTGRAFADLEEASGAVRELHDGPWDYDGPGIVLVGTTVGDRFRAPVVIVLSRTFLDADLPEVEGTTASGRHISASYGFWFALVEAQPETEVTMWLTLPVNEEGRAMLEEHDVPLRAPFVVRTERTAYVAGNLGAAPVRFPTRQIAGSLPVLQRLPLSGDADVFYEVYAPLLGDLIELAEAPS